MVDKNDIIGLRRHTVRVVGHHPGWAALASDACREIRESCGGLVADVQHVGSTAVPGLPAKPVLDLAAAVYDVRVVPELGEKLTALGYIYRGDGGDSGGRLFVMNSAPDVRTIHLHVVALDDVQWKNYLQFRDMLVHDPVLRERYAGLKKALYAKYPNDRKSYTKSKNEFIQDALESDI